MPIDPDEWATIVDEDDRLVGRARRAEVRARKLLHRGVAVLVRNSQGDIYVHRRTVSKDIFPGMYDVFIAGMVPYGESYEEAASRELNEELGVSGTDLRPLFKHLYASSENPSWNAVFETVWDGAIVHEADEIDWGGFVPLDELDAKMASWSVVPDGNEVYKRWRAEFR